MTYLTSHTQSIATTTPRCDRSSLTQSDCSTIARVLTWDMCIDVQPHEVITIAITNGIVQVKLTGGRTALLSVDTFKSILKQQRQQLDREVAIVEQLEQRLEKDSNEIKLVAHGKIYPMWRGIQRKSTFYLVGKNWNWQVINDEASSGFKAATTVQNPFAQLPTSDEDKEVAA